MIAIAAGVSDGMGFGLNARAALLTRGLAEISRLGVEIGGRQETFMGLAGMGDLILTCTGDLSRNRRVGLALAEGKSLAQILTDLGHVAEGVSTAHEVAVLARRSGVEMPICAAVDALLHDGVDARQVVEQLLSRDPSTSSLARPALLGWCGAGTAVSRARRNISHHRLHLAGRDLRGARHAGLSQAPRQSRTVSTPRKPPPRRNSTG